MEYSYNITTRLWSKIRTFHNQHWGSSITFANDRVYYIDNGESIICLNPQTQRTNSLAKRMRTDKIKRMISHMGYLYVAGETFIEKYDFSTETWTLVTNIIFTK